MPRHPGISPTTGGLSSSVYQALRSRALSVPGRVHALHVGDTWREPAEVARCEQLATSEHPLLHAYPPVHGEPELLEIVQARLRAQGGRTVERSDIQIVAGATGGLSVACQALLDPGDEVLVPTPCWPLFPGIVSSRGAVPVQVPVMTRLGDASLDLERELEARISPRSAAIYLNTPHNPTGALLTSDQIEAFVSVAKRHSLWLLCDDVYDEIVLGDSQVAPGPIWAREDVSGRCIVMHSISKSHGMAGCRVGWAHGPAEAMAAIRAVFTQQVYAVARPMQRLAARALQGSGAWLVETRALYTEAARAASGALDVPMPAAGTFLFADATRWLREGEDVTGLLTRCLEAGVLLTPGAACGRDFESWIRLCYTSVSRDALDDALDRLRPVLSDE